MFHSKYLIRLDDASKNMDIEKWTLFENLFLRYNIFPIIAVVPNNCDSAIKFTDDLHDFWNIIKRWQSYGWTIAMHGYSHELHRTYNKTLINLNNYGEFGELEYNIQADKITKSLNLFKTNEIDVNLWIAPAHNFDNNTLKALLANTNIRKISDGQSFNIFFKNDFFWIPQQLWRFKFCLFGIRTICLHPNEMTIEQIKLFEKNLKKNQKYITSFNDLQFIQRPKSLFDHSYEYLFYFKRRMIKLIFSRLNKIFKH